MANLLELVDQYIGNLLAGNLYTNIKPYDSFIKNNSPLKDNRPVIQPSLESVKNFPQQITNLPRNLSTVSKEFSKINLDTAGNLR